MQTPPTAPKSTGVTAPAQSSKGFILSCYWAVHATGNHEICQAASSPYQDPRVGRLSVKCSYTGDKKDAIHTTNSIVTIQANDFTQYRSRLHASPRRRGCQGRRSSKPNLHRWYKTIVMCAHLSACNDLPDADGHGCGENDDSEAVQPDVTRRAVRQPALALCRRLERLHASHRDGQAVRIRQR